MNSDKPITLSFDEDNYDPDEYKKTAKATVRKRVRIGRIRRKIKYGKAILAVLSLAVSVFLYYMISVVFNVF